MEALLSAYVLLASKTTKIITSEDNSVKLVYILGDLRAINFRKYFRKKLKYFAAFPLNVN